MVSTKLSRTLILGLAFSAFALCQGMSSCNVSIVTKMSSHSCDENYGCFNNGSMFVKNGCRGVFRCNGIDSVICDPCDPASKNCNTFLVCECKAALPPPKYLLLDDRNVIDASGASFVLGQIEKHKSSPMITEEADYEMRFDNMQPSVWYDPQMAKWRAWYSTFTSCSKPKAEVPYCNNASQQCGSATVGQKASRGSGFLYAESEDGLTWYKPNLNMVEWKGSKTNNLIELDGMTTQVYLDEASTDPSARYKIVTGSNGKGAIAISADGIHWNSTKDLEPETHARWDTPKNIVWDSVRKQWIMFVRSQPTLDGMRIQSVSHSLTENFMGAWSPATPTGLNTSLDYQPDGLVVWPYEGIYIGIGNVFNPTQAPAAAGAAIGQVNMVLGWSADGRRWKWLLPSQSFIPLGTAGQFDACGVFGAKQDPLRAHSNMKLGGPRSRSFSSLEKDDPDTLRLYYTGCNGPFFGSRGCALGLATLQRDGFAGYRGGTVTTAPIRVSSAMLKVSVDGGASEGIQVGIVGADDLSVENCDPIKGKHVDVVVTWKGSSDLSKYMNGAFSLVFKIPADATAFAYSV